MSIPSQLDPLTNRQKDFCSYGGTFGVLIAATCFIQLMIYGLSNWKTTTLFFIYFFVLVSFFFLALQKQAATILLTVSAALTLFAEIIWIRSGAFSLIVLLLLIYNIIAVVFLYVEQVAERLKQKRIALKTEEAIWKGKI